MKLIPVILACLAAALTPLRAAEKKPNILFILGDDMGCASRSQTPFGNALAGETLFRGGG